VPNDQQWSGNEWAAAVTADARLVSEPVCIRQRGSTYYFDSLYVRRTVDCRAEAGQFGEAGSPVYDAFYARCRDEADTTAAVPMVSDSTYAGFYLVVYDPDGGSYRMVSTRSTTTFSADSVNEFGFSTELPPPTDSTSGLPGGDPLPVATKSFQDLQSAVDNIVPVTDWLPSSAFSVYPNPSSGTVRLEIVPEIDLERAELYDLRGRRLHLWSLAIERSVRLTGLPTGVYLVIVSGAAGRGVRRLVVR
jgi:hypothetical protein